MKRTFVRLAVTAITILPLGACGGEDSGQTAAAPPPPVVAAPPPQTSTAVTVESFGSGYASTFRGAAAAEARDSGEADVIPVSLTAEASEPTGF